MVWNYPFAWVGGNRFTRRDGEHEQCCLLVPQSRLRERQLQGNDIRELASGDSNRNDNNAAYPLRDQRSDTGCN